ncbi:MAG: IS91 family transposase, partial [Planctomycetes bacterium]|nr:IS91 family transposase [Planctomycetota bacterium]
MQRKAMRAIVTCRTAALGGQRESCPQCGFSRYRYHSCRNRHCPKCQSLAKAEWLEDRQQELLPTPYFHNVFTLPHELNPLVLTSERNRRALWGLLFQAASETLLAFGRNNLGGTIGLTLVLHTWDQQLRPHFHVHAVVTGGALANDGSQWIDAGRKLLFPVKALSKVFRGKYVEGVEKLLAQNELDLPPQWIKPDDQRRLVRTLRRKAWIVYSKRPFAGPEKLLDYLGRYTHRVAISNHRLLSLQDGQVTFAYRDRRDGDRKKTRQLPAEEFVGRFLKHILPDGFMRIRHYGLLANRTKKERLAACRQVLAAVTPEPQERKTWAE